MIPATTRQHNRNWEVKIEEFYPQMKMMNADGRIS
jgi:hypothetical protein